MLRFGNVFQTTKCSDNVIKCNIGGASYCLSLVAASRRAHVAVVWFHFIVFLSKSLHSLRGKFPIYTFIRCKCKFKSDSSQVAE